MRPSALMTASRRRRGKAEHFTRGRVVRFRVCGQSHLRSSNVERTPELELRTIFASSPKVEQSLLLLHFFLQLDPPLKFADRQPSADGDGAEAGCCTLAIPPPTG